MFISIRDKVIGIVGIVLIFLSLMFCIWSGSKLAVSIMVVSWAIFVFGILIISVIFSNGTGVSSSPTKAYLTIFLGGLCVLGMVTALVLALLQYF
jgi:hypothetical protein